MSSCSTRRCSRWRRCWGPGSGHAIALAQARDDPQAGLALLGAIDDPSLPAHQPWRAARTHLLAGAGRIGEAIDAFGRARALGADEAVRRHLDGRAQAMHTACR